MADPWDYLIGLAATGVIPGAGLIPGGLGNRGRKVREAVTALPGVAGDLAYGMVGPLMGPGRAARGDYTVQPTTPGLWSEEDEARQQLANRKQVEDAFGIATTMSGSQMPFAAENTLGAAGGRGAKPPKPTRMTEVPSLRGLPVEEATAIAAKEPHLIPGGEGSPGYYAGGPRNIESRRDLTKMRRGLDEYIAADPRGGDWYDRYRAAMNEVTGGDPVANRWMANQEGMMSAGVGPNSELAFALKENNANIAGMPVKAARPAQHEAQQRAVEALDPTEYMLGRKTGQYARLIEPDPGRIPGATGVNDFRHARNIGYTQTSGKGQTEAVGKAAHTFMDYETALAVKRANETNLGGRNDWTGEQLQAAPWVRQKALDIAKQRGISYEEAFKEANKTIADFFPKHTAFATHEAQPGAQTGHLPGSVGASSEERAAFAADPRSNWAFAPGARDAIYAGLGVPGTGNVMRVRPSTQMQGVYTTPAGVTEVNPGAVARPLVAFNTGKVKSIAPADRALLDAGEALRGYLDVQNASAWHKPWEGGAAGLSNSMFIPAPGKMMPAQLAEMQARGMPRGLTEAWDTGQGVTMTGFGDPKLAAKDFKGENSLAAQFQRMAGGSEPVERVKVDTGYLDYVPDWQKGVGSGAATRTMLEKTGATPGLAAAMNANPYIPQAARDRLLRNQDWAQKWGAPREDVQNALRIISEGGSQWREALAAALKAGAILPATATAIYAVAAGQGQPARQ